MADRQTLRDEFGPGWPYHSAPERNYETDPAFRALVDMMHQEIRAHRFSPSEMRAAAVLACIKYEERVVPARMSEESLREMLGGEETALDARVECSRRSRRGF